MYPVVTGAVYERVLQMLRPSARWSARRAAVILTVLAAHLSLMVSPLHAAHHEQAIQAVSAPYAKQPLREPAIVAAAASSDAHVEGHTSHAATPDVRQASATLPSAATLTSRETLGGDCGIQWTRTRQQATDSSLLAVAAAPSLDGLQLSPSSPAHRALSAPLRHGDIQALLQVYRL